MEKPVKKKASRASRSKVNRVRKTLAAFSRSHKRIFGRRLHDATGLSLLFLGVFLGLVFLAGQPPRQSNAQSCTVSSILVNSCRPWLGASAGKYPQVASNIKAQVLYHEQRIGHKLDMVHTYHTPGQVLSSDDSYFASRANTYLFADWKPATNWASANGSNASVNAGIDKMAASIKSLGSKNIFMTIWHEPENDVSGGATGCASTVYKGSAGTPAQYRAMWANVENRFKADGATNVVWAMDYMNYSRFDCMVDDLYPGNGLIDWISFNAYMGSANGKFASNVQRFQALLQKDQDSSHDFNSKPWGIVEWNTQGLGTTTAQYSYYDQAKASLDANQFPKLKFYMIFDNVGPEGNENRTMYLNGVASQTKQNHYNAFADDPIFTNSSTPTPTPTPAPQPGSGNTAPPVTITTPKNGAVVSGNLAIAGIAKDNARVKAVALRVDGKWLSTDASSPYRLNFNTHNYFNGKHALLFRTWDKANNHNDSRTITVDIENHFTYLKAGTKASSTPVVAAGKLVITPTADSQKMTVKLADKVVRDTIDTTKLTNGIHTVKVTEDGKTKVQKIRVKNDWKLAAANSVKASPVAYSAGALAVFVVCAIGITCSGISSRLRAYRDRNYVRF